MSHDRTVRRVFFDFLPILIGFTLGLFLTSFSEKEIGWTSLDFAMFMAVWTGIQIFGNHIRDKINDNRPLRRTVDEMMAEIDARMVEEAEVAEVALLLIRQAAEEDNERVGE